MPHVIVVENPRYSRAYSSAERYRRFNDRVTLNQGEAWAARVDEDADGVATPEYLAEHSTARRRPQASLGNALTHCVIPLPAGWERFVPNPERPGIYNTTLPQADLSRAVEAFQDQIRWRIVERTVETYRRAALWSRPHGVVSVLVGHGVSVKARDPDDSEVYLDVAPANAATASIGHLTQLAEMVRERRRQGRSFHDIAQGGWDSTSTVILRMADAFRRARVRRVDFLVCQTGIGAQGTQFLNLLQSFFGARVRGTRGNAIYTPEGHWYIMRPRGPNPRYRSGSYGETGGVLATNDPAEQAHVETGPTPFPGYPNDAAFRSSTGARAL